MGTGVGQEVEENGERDEIFDRARWERRLSHCPMALRWVGLGWGEQECQRCEDRGKNRRWMQEGGSVRLRLCERFD